MVRLMVDGRRGRWIAFDASFFDGSVGEMILDRFGPAGITLFVAFLCACKRNAIQGQIEYGSVPDAMSLMGIPDLELVDTSGVAWDLQSFWRALAAHKQCSTRARGRLTQVKSSKWAKWQEGFNSQKEAARKSRSRATKAPDDAPPIAGSYSADTPPELETEYETDIETDNETTNHSVELAVCDPQAINPDRPPQAVGRVFEAWLVSTGRTDRTILDAKRRKLIGRALTQYPVADLVDAVQGWRNSPHHRGENETRTVYNDLELLLRDAAHIERFRDYQRQATSTLAVVPMSENMRLLNSMRRPG